MPQKRYKPEEIINKLRVAEVELSKGHTTGQINQTYLSACMAQ